MKGRKGHAARKKPKKRPAFIGNASPFAKLIRRDENGLRHLVLRRDAATGASQLGLGAPLFAEGWQNDVALATATTAHAALRTSLDLPRALELTRHLMDKTSQLSDGLLARAGNGRVACRAGCSHCCYQPVGVTPPEAFAIHAHVLETFSSDELDQLRARVLESRERARNLTKEERFSPEHPCAFLKDSTCSIYEVRPLACRGMNSLDADACERTLRDPDARADFLRTGRGRESFLEPIRAAAAVSAGAQLGLSELFQLDMRPLDLTAALDELLRGSNSLPLAWLEGESPLESARGADNSQDLEALIATGTLRT